MKKFIFPLALVCFGISAHAQQDIFALTGKGSQQIQFNDFRSLDMKAGVSGETFLNDQSLPNVFSQTTNAPFTESKSSIHHAQTPSMAALAYDASGNDLVYIPMFSSNLYVLDAKSKKITLVENTVVKSVSCDIGSHITRMTTGSDGNIYAMSNSGSQLIQISKKNGKYSLTDLGKIKDISNNPQVAINMVQTGFGGDMIADANGDLYVFSASGNVFRISLKNLTSEFIGKVSGLPENYSLNGAAVNSAGKIVVASAKGGNFYEVTFDGLQAKPINNGLNYNIYDLASRYLVNDNSKIVTNPTFAGVDVYPTRVKDYVNINLGDKNKGQALVEIYNGAGIKILSKNLKISERNTIHQIDLGNFNTGLYIINVKDESGKQIITKKIIIE